MLYQSRGLHWIKWEREHDMNSKRHLHRQTEVNAQSLSEDT